MSEDQSPEQSDAEFQESDSRTARNTSVPAGESGQETPDEQIQAQGADSQRERPDAEIGFLFALEIESGGLQDRMQQTKTVRSPGFKAVYGEVSGRQSVVIITGPGKANAENGARILAEYHSGLRCIVSAGFAGGLVEGFARNETVLVERVIEQLPDTEKTEEVKNKTAAQHSASHLAKVRLDKKMNQYLAESFEPPLRRASLLTVGRMVHDPEIKSGLHESTGAELVDMESYAVARVCSENGIPLIGVRIIIDPVDERLPEDVEPLMEKTTLARKTGQVIGTLWRRPSSLKDMFRLNENAQTASQLLGQTLVEVIEKLPN